MPSRTMVMSFFTVGQDCQHEPSGDALQCKAAKRIVSANVAWEL
jgi:hypothetical protein